ncbi:hypothetical protein [Rhodococcoides fascians]|uniref:hypothetical protein n=1 Tax=Rhodococcoides fascians TaxID=1828 RepID=UPI00056B09B9|nr:hypothetical protein [Rhodococcus fascians]
MALLAGELDSAAAEVLVDQTQVRVGVGVEHSYPVARCAAGQVLSDESSHRPDLVVCVGGMNDRRAERFFGRFDDFAVFDKLG